MAELSTLARPYAKAAFEYARAQDALGEWSKQLGICAAVVGDNLAVVRFGASHGRLRKIEMALPLLESARAC